MSYRPHPLGLGNVLHRWPDGTCIVVMAGAVGPAYLVVTPDDELLLPDGRICPLVEGLMCGADFGSEIDARLAVEVRRNAHPENR